MSVIKMQFDEVHANAKVYGKAKEEILQMLTNLNTVQGNLKSAWDGMAMQAFDQQFDALVPKVKEFSDLMGVIEHQLISVANTMQEVDERLHRAILNQ